MKYLADERYDDAIVAFSAAIEIDPKRVEAYIGRGDAYVGSGTGEYVLTLAEADYKMALELDGTLTDAYLSLSDVLIKLGKTDEVINLILLGLEKARSRDELELVFTTLAGGVVRTETEEEEDGTTETEYDALNRVIRYHGYMKNPSSPQFNIEYETVIQYERDTRVIVKISDSEEVGSWSVGWDGSIEIMEKATL